MTKRSGVEKGIVLAIRAKRVTEEILQSMLADYLKNRAKPRGLTSLAELKKSGVKLESIEITEKNIGGFLSCARKYDITYALKRDVSTAPPTYYVFFETDDKSLKNLNKSFAEFTAAKKEKSDKQRDLQEELLREKRKKDIEKENAVPETDEFEERV